MANLTVRLECLIDPETHEAIMELARELAPTDDPRMHRSAAARELLADGIAKRRRTRKSVRPAA